MINLQASTLAADVERLVGERVVRCNQCGKCTAGCPMAVEMDLQPNQVMRLTQLGHEDKLLRSRAIWLCASCETCATRCPMGVSLAEVMDALRALALERGVADTSTRVPQFHQAFLDSVRRNGRTHEVAMIGQYKMKTGRFFDDVALGVRMFFEGKLALMPSRIEDRATLARLFRRSHD
jgi:heterodisulfide reductase subunit C2